MGAAPSGIRRFHPREHCRARLACFPHAGGAATAFAPMSARLLPDIELLAVQYPGRQERWREPPAPDIMTLARESARALLPYADRPLALLGHSMGALVAFETARLIAGQCATLRLFASAARPPSQDWAVADLDAQDDTTVMAHLRRLGGVPESLLSDKGIRDEILRVLRADYRMARRYQFGHLDPAPVPITAIVGDADPTTRIADAEAWSRHTEARFDVNVLPGGHFYLNAQVSDLAELARRRILADLANRSMTAQL